MSNINNLNLEKIFSKIGSTLTYSDVVYFTNDEKIINEYFRLYNTNKTYDLQPIMELLIRNEDKINKEKLVFCIYLNYKRNLDLIANKIEKLSANETEELCTYIKQEKIQKELMQKAKVLLKDSNVNILKVKYSNNRLYPELCNSREMIQNRKKSESKNLERIEQIDKELSEDGDDGTLFLLQVLILSDLKSIIPDKYSGLELRECILNNAICDKGEYSIMELNNMKENDFNKYTNIIDNIEPEYYLPEFRKEILNNIRFIDIDKLLLLVAYRFEEYLEDVENPTVNPEIINNIINYIKSKINNKNIAINEELEKRVTYKPTQVQYKYIDLEEFSRRVIGNTYIKKSEIEKTKIALKSGTILLDEVDPYLSSLLELGDCDLEEIMSYSDENFAYAIEKLNLNQKEILNKLKYNTNRININLLSYLYDTQKVNIYTIEELYSEGLISAKLFKEFSSENDISEELNLKKINEKYLELKKQETPKQEEIEQLERLIELYKIVNIQEKTPEELEEISNSVMYEIAENFEDEKDIIFYYEKGLVTLETVSEWAGEEIIEELYNKSKITFEDLEILYKSNKISKELIQRKISLDDMDYNTLITNIMYGYVSEDRITDLYMQGKIFDIDFEKMAIEGKVRIDKYFEAKSKRTKEILEENAKIKFKPILYNIPDKKIRMNIVYDESKSNGGISYAEDNRNKTLIDPNIRYEFLKILGAKEADAVILDEDNAFYNYEFFVIPDSQGNLQEDSVVIAERFFEDKEIQDRFATDNATYFFQYKDLMVNSNLSKKDMVQNRDNVIFTANHRAGSWAVSVLYKLAETMAGDDFKQYKKGDKRAGKVLDELHKIYSPEKIKKILDLAGRIDDSNEYIYEEINSGFRKSTKNDGEER